MQTMPMLAKVLSAPTTTLPTRYYWHDHCQNSHIIQRSKYI